VTFIAPKPAWKGGFFLLCLISTGILTTSLWLVFNPALPGIVHFDDIGNLSGLPTIVDPTSAWRWIRDGHAGLFGRPLALITFALQYFEWPHPEAFLEWNIALHIVNALLLFWLAVLVIARMEEPAVRQVVIGFSVALTWAVLPLLNTSVLFIIQRMTLLASTFILAGLVGYLKCRGAVRSSWFHQLSALLMLAAFGGLALLAKESGALVVVYGLVLEFGLIAIARERRLTISAFGLLLASVLLVAGLIPHAFWHTCAELTRGFDLLQRLGSQGVLLPVYLKGLFLPRIGDLNPFRFEYMLRDIPNLQWGIVIWFILMISPLVIWWRGWRLAALVSAWFFYGHIMESGWVNLEPYFAHRNYLPAMGLVFGLTYGVFSIRHRRKLWRGIFSAYIIVLASLTWMNTSLWGNRDVAAEIWAIEQPRSVRAALNLTYGLESTQGLWAAQRYLDRFVAEGRDSVGLRLQGLITACVLDPDSDHSKQLGAVQHAIVTLPYEGWATDLVEKLMERVHRHVCRGVSIDQVAEIAATFLNQTAYQCSRPLVHNMLWIIGLVAMEHGDTRKAMDFYFRGLKESVSYSMAAFYFDLALQQGDWTAIEALKDLLKNAPLPRGATQVEWQQLLDRINDKLNVLKKNNEENAE